MNITGQPRVSKFRERTPEPWEFWPPSLTDSQLQAVMTAANALEPDKRCTLLERVAAQLRHLSRISRAPPTDADVDAALRLALNGLMQAPPETAA